MNMQMKKALVASALAVALAAVGLASGCAAHTETYTGVQTPGIMTQPVEDTLKAAAEKAAAEKAEKALAAQREAAKKAAEEAALDGGEIVEDANAPEGTVAVKAADGTTRYVAADKAQASVDSGKTAPKKSESASNGGSNSGSSNSASSGNSGSSNKGNSGSSNSGSSSSSNGGSNSGSASKPAPAPEPEPAPAPEPEPAPEPDDSGMHGSVEKGQCLDCGWSGTTGGASACPGCGGTDGFMTWN